MTLPASLSPARFLAAVEAARRAGTAPTAGRLTSFTVLDSADDRTLALASVAVENMGRRLPADFEHGTIRFDRWSAGGTILSADDPAPGQLELTVRLGGLDDDPPSYCRVQLRPYDHLAALADWARQLDEIPTTVTTLLGAAALETPGPSEPLSSAGIGPLDAMQRRAVAHAAREALLLWGPPGTGKTHTLGAAVAAMRREGWRVVVMAISNAAVDVATLAIDDACERMRRPLEPGELIRLGTPRHPLLEDGGRPHLLAFQQELDRLNRHLANLRRSLAATIRLIRNHKGKGLGPPGPALAMQASLLDLIRDAEERRRDLTRKHVDSASIVCTTAASFLQLNQPHRADAVIVDEGSQMPLAFLAPAAASAPARLHVVGDPMQLPPIVPQLRRRDLRHEADLCELFGTSRFALAGLDPADPGFERTVNRLEASGSVVTLLEQRRMAPEIGEAVNQLAYDGRLRHAAPAYPPPNPVAGLPADRLVYLRGPSREGNPNHIQAEVTQTVARALARGADGGDTRVLVITPFRAQEKLLTDLLGSVPGIRVLTIHKAQGSEAPFVVLDVPKPRSPFLDNSAEARLLWNVALSRAQQRLVLVAPPAIASNRWIGPLLHRFTPADWTER